MESEETQGRYPDVVYVIEEIVSSDAWPDGPVDRIVIHLHASGDATWRVREAISDAEAGGYIAPR